MKNRERGLSLVELLVAITVLLLGVVPLMRLFMFSLRTGNRAHKMSVATNLARGIAEEIRTKAFSEEFTVGFADDPDYYYPNTTTSQSFGLEETFGTSDVRFNVFDDVDDYNNWCRGRDCDCTGITPATLCATSTPETHDGHPYDGSDGYPDYNGFTRRIQVFNLFVLPELTYERTPYENISTPILINRFNFEESNFPNLTVNDDGVHALGHTPLKVIDVMVTYRAPVGITREDVEVHDVSMSVMPLVAEQSD
jgi:type II secretory pathway pseudopilin PulG